MISWTYIVKDVKHERKEGEGSCSTNTGQWAGLDDFFSLEIYGKKKNEGQNREQMYVYQKTLGYSKVLR